MTTAVVPLKALASAKSRLSGSLGPDGRRAVVGWMLQRVLGACAGACGISDVLVVAGDSDAAALASRSGAGVLLHTQPGLQAALRRADAAVGARAATLIVVADLPACRDRDLEALLAAAPVGPAGPAVVLAPTGDGGTGALLRRPGTVIPPAFGESSAAAHTALARRAHVPLSVCHRLGLSGDVDTPAQLLAAAAGLPELAALLAAHGGPLPPPGHRPPAA